MGTFLSLKARTQSRIKVHLGSMWAAANAESCRLTQRWHRENSESPGAVGQGFSLRKQPRWLTGKENFPDCHLSPPVTSPQEIVPASPLHLKWESMPGAWCCGTIQPDSTSSKLLQESEPGVDLEVPLTLPK